MKKKIITTIITTAVIASLCGCGTTSNSSNSTNKNASASAVETSSTSSAEIDTSNMFSDRDYEITYDDAEVVTLKDNASSSDSNGVSMKENTITITKEGSYILSGTLSDGQIVVDTDESAKVQLVLDDASITNNGSAAIYVLSADKVFVTTTDSDNTLASTGDYEESEEGIDGVIYSKDDITFNGAGTLNVKSEAGHGIVGKDDVKITNGTYVIDAKEHGIDANDSVRAADGNITITSGKDGIHIENTKDTSKGYFYSCGGTFKINATYDGIDASGQAIFDDGTFDITSGGGYKNAKAHESDMPGDKNPFPNGEMPNFSNKDSFKPDGTNPPSDFKKDDIDNTESSTETSTKGIKADSGITVNGGTFDIDSADDTLHTSTTLTINDGTLNMASGDDGMHADTSIVIDGGNINISNSYEGIEAHEIEINDGKVTLTASDDGLNANGSEDATLTINGGEMEVIAGGDGVDSNGVVNMNGGAVYISGPDNGGNGSLDYGTSAIVTGGTFIAAGASGMAENFGSDSTQCSILYELSSSVASGTTITLKDNSGNEIASYTPSKDFQTIVISSKDISSSGTYELVVGDDSYTIEMSGTIYGSGSGMMHGGFGK